MNELKLTFTNGIVTVKVDEEIIGHVTDGMFILHDGAKVPTEIIQQAENAIISIWEYLE